MRTLFLSTALALAACAKPIPLDGYYRGDREAALQQQEQRAGADSPEQALENCRLASMALAMGDTALAESALRRAVGTMQNFQADGEWMAIIGAEERKEWKGEPYEKMTAFLYLGVLLHSKGDYGNALAMYKSAILADTGSSHERYRSDFIPAWVMQALAYQAVHESSNAERSLDQAVNALYVRGLTPPMVTALSEVRVSGDEKKVAAARAALLTALPGGLTASPRDPQAAIKATLSQATDLLHSQLELPDRDRVAALELFKDKHLEGAFEVLGELTAGWSRNVSAWAADPVANLAAEEAVYRKLLDDPPNVVLLIENGPGPRKTAVGRHNEILRIVDGGPFAGQPAHAIPLDSGGLIYGLDNMGYQAATRGSRQVDGFLRGKAVFKDTATITGQALADIADSLSDSSSEAALILYSAALVATVAGAATNPAADTREWGLLPQSLWLLTMKLPPGDHPVTVQGHQHVVHVPAKGTVVALVPQLVPGGSVDIPASADSRRSP